MEGLIFRRASVRREICVSKSIGLAGSGKEIYHFCFVFTLYSRANSQYKPPGGAYIRRGNLTVGFLRYDFGGLIHGGAYFRNFMVCWSLNSVHTSHLVGCLQIKMVPTKSYYSILTLGRNC